jgi:type VI secretion system protein ImpH
VRTETVVSVGEAAATEALRAARTAAAELRTAEPAEVVRRDRTLEEQLYEEPFAFDFFQAVRVLEKLFPDTVPVGRAGPLEKELVRFQAHLSLSFPPSSIYDLERGVEGIPAPVMTVSFLGLTGPSGVLPRHYTEMLLRQERDAKGREKRALRAWLDLFNHRFISLFRRAWEKYRPFVAYERGEYAKGEPDAFSRTVFSLVGLGTPALRDRLRVATWDEERQRQQVLARLDDLTLAYFGGFLSRRVGNATSLEAMLADYLGLPVEVRQFRGQWLVLDEANQSRLGEGALGCALGVNAVAGDRVWDVQSKFRVRVGPLSYDRFLEFLPDKAPQRERKSFFLLCHLVRTYVGPEVDFDVQVVLRKEDVPECQLADGNGAGPRLGWNTWVRSAPYPRDAGDAVFDGDEVVWVR